MSSINKYESLKTDGTWIDRLKYVLSLSDKTEIEKYLKQSSITCYEDLKMLIFLSISIKNEKNLLEIFKNNSLPVRQRAYAFKGWLNIQKDEKQIHNFTIESINDKNIPRYLKHAILKDMHRINILKKSSSFFYDLICHLTESNNHDQYNIDAHLVPFCTKEQIINLLSRWSIKRLEQIDRESTFYAKLIRYQPLIFIHLVKSDLNELKSNKEKFSKYFEVNNNLFETLSKKIPKELIHLSIEYLNQLEKHRRFLPSIIQSKQKYFFKKAPGEMIELITIAASNQPGQIKYQTSWGDEGYELGQFSFPRTFSVENYVRLFFTLYDTCKWSSNHTINLVKYMLSDSEQEKSIKKQRKWFYDIIICQRIRKELFIEKLLKQGDENTLILLENYPELTTPLSLHLISQYERKGIVDAKQRLTLIHYQLMTEDLYNQFLSLFKQTGSDVNQRQKNYPLFLQCAISTNDEYVKKVLQWIEKRFTNEQLIVIEEFLRQLSTYNKKIHLEILPNNFESIQTIINLAINHLQQSSDTLRIIIEYGILLLKHAEHYSNKEQKEKIRTFAIKLIKQCYSKHNSLSVYVSSISESYPETRNLLVDIFISDLFPKFISKSMINELNDALNRYFDKAWRLPQIDSFLNTFFTENLHSSTKLQSAFKIDTHTTMISFYLKNKSTRLERVNYLINKFGKLFFINEDIQRIILRSQQYRQLIDQLIQDEKSVTLDKLTDEENKFAGNLETTTKNIKLPGLELNLLNSYSQFLTGKQQEHITKIILNDYLQDSDVSNLNKLKSLRVLRRLTHTYKETLEWINKGQDSQLAVKNPNESSGGRNRGAAAQPLDDIIICLPSTFDLTPENLLKHLELLKTKLNAANAKYISDAMLSISRKIPDEIFLKHYLEFIQNEQFQKLGITANKEILRLLIQYVNDPSLIKIVIKPLWDSHPHQDVRACIISTLLHFVGKTKSTDDENIVWNILEQAADDDYFPVVQSLFAAQRGESRWPLTKLNYSSNEIFQTFINRIQFKILDHPTSLQARSWAWANIDYKHCNTNKLIEKAQQICIQFDKNANSLWRNAFEKVLLSYKDHKISSIDIIIDIIKNIMLCREEIDSKENAIDNQHDLPVYHRIQNLFATLNTHINQFDNEKKLSFHSLTLIILQFDKTLAPLLGKFLIHIVQNKEELENLLKIFQENLPENYFENILIDLSQYIYKDNSSPFIQQLNTDEKFDLAKWFIEEKNRPLFVFELLKNHVFNQSNVDKEQCRKILQQIRKSENLYLRQQAMEYTVPWKEDGNVSGDDGDDNNEDQMSVSGDSHSDMN